MFCGTLILTCYKIPMSLLLEVGHNSGRGPVMKINYSKFSYMLLMRDQVRTKASVIPWD